MAQGLPIDPISVVVVVLGPIAVAALLGLLLLWVRSRLRRPKE